MSGATGVEDVGVTERFEKAVLKLHCVLCGDTMFVMDISRYVCIECNVRQEVTVRLGTHSYESRSDGSLQSFEGEDILPEEVRISIEKASVDTDLLKEFMGFVEMLK
jgi:hypothetical protein